MKRQVEGAPSKDDLSMDEILTSIRQIISGEEKKPLAAERSSSFQENEKEEGVLELKKGPAHRESTGSAFEDYKGMSSLSVKSPAASRTKSGGKVENSSSFEHKSNPPLSAVSQEGFLSDEAARAATASLARFKKTVGSADRHPAPPEGASLCLEERLYKAMEGHLRPLLKAWLEGKLPDLVERVVREEIRRLTK